jgi:hypothetical protein
MPLKLLTILLALSGIAAATRMESCKTRIDIIKLKRAEFYALQRFVNAGHEPWRLQSVPVAAEEILRRENTPKERWDVFGIRLSPVSEASTRAIYDYSSKDNPAVKYRIYVIRPSWLLRLAGSRSSVLWTAVKVETTNCALR